MKPITLKTFVTFLLFCLIETALLAQDSSSGSTTKTSKTSIKVSSEQSENWYTSPWVWVAGAAVFILLLVALTRGGGSRRTDSGRTDKVTVTKEVRRDTDVND